METSITDLIAQSERLRELVAAEIVLTAAAYGYPVENRVEEIGDRAETTRLFSISSAPISSQAPDEAPSPAFQEARRDAEARCGSRLTKVFVPADLRPAAQAPGHILIISEARMLTLPEPLLSQAQACEKAYAAGRWYITVPAALWQAFTRLLGERSW